MKIETRRDQGITLIVLSGRFDAGVVASFKEYMEQFSMAGPEFFVVDMTEVNYIDSGGLGCLVSFLRKVRQVEGDIKIAMVSDKVRSVFELTRLHRIFEMYDDTKVAVKSYLRDVPARG